LNYHAVLLSVAVSMLTIHAVFIGSNILLGFCSLECRIRRVFQNLGYSMVVMTRQRFTIHAQRQLQPN
jgi:hypothetical protein